ncbi:hypothetical protein A5630_10895 [Mycolicibacterium mucogenicum]|uniref:Uncharacterized protein n=1 Tax=Mycolicibacterium mucogenicum TaxID=56689 RepID=A0A1A3HGT8_MYCMU|nr:hypothetical protein [Mycolicibacterium mucogenicum]OBJ46843.1 hypothetical protein A5630_10895 [Mycolicibacterium mucogenicum]
MSTAGTMIQHHTCQSCQGPCLHWKGDVWGYTCAACIRQHLDAQAARVDAKQRRAHERLAQKALNILRNPQTHSSVR